MIRRIFIWLLFVLLPYAASAYVSTNGTNYLTDGSQADVASAVTDAVDGETIWLPPGSFTWSSSLAVSGKGVHIRGSGSGRVVGRSTSSVAVGTGSKTWTVATGLAIYSGQTLTVERMGGVIADGNPTGARASMTGTVSSYSGTTLTMSIASVVGSGTHPLWYISSGPTTTVTHSSSSTLLDLTEDTTHSVQLSGIRFVSGTAGEGDDFVEISRVTSGKPILIHDAYFELSHSADVIQTDANRGVFSDMDLVAVPFALSALGVHTADGPTNSWATASTMGSADTDGAGNIYMEDCYCVAWRNSTDFDNSSRAVVRHCTMDNSGVGTHGADSSSYGMRHLEVYKTTFIWDGYDNGQSMPINQWFLWRGGTGVIASNVIENLGSVDFGDKPEVRLCIWNIDHSWGPNPCWGANIVGIQYPCPRQVGMGRVTGAAGSDSITYIGDVEPLYVWQNDWTVYDTTPMTTLESYGTADCTNPDDADDYVQQGRDLYTNNTAKPGWAPYTYPHPLRSEAAGDPDTNAPVISALSTNATATNCTVTWTTDEAATSGLAWGLTSSYTWGATNASAVTDHSLIATNLASSTLYHFAVYSTDGSTNGTNSADYTFTTTAAGTAAPRNLRVLGTLRAGTIQGR